MDAPEPDRRLTTLDMIAGALAIMAAALLVIFPAAVAPGIVRMHRDFGSEMSGPTRLVLTGWVPLTLALLPGLPVVLALGPLRTWSHRRRRWLLVGGFLGGSVALMTLLWALYLPIVEIEIAGAIH
jgi:hypothetical protein